MSACESCEQVKPTRAAYIQGIYYRRICDNCIGGSSADDRISSGVTDYERRRGYEDNAQDTIQPYDANGKPNTEFARLYPKTAKKVFGAQRFDDLRRSI